MTWRILAFLLGVLSVAAAVFAVRTGHTKERFGGDVFIMKNPTKFWLHVVMYTVLAVLSFFTAFKGRRKDN